MKECWTSTEERNQLAKGVEDSETTVRRVVGCMDEKQ